MSMTALMRSDAVRSWEVEGEAVIYDPVSGMGHVLNPTALGIWQLCDGRHTVRDIERELALLFPESTDAIREDIPAAVAQLLELKLAQEVATV